FYGEDIEFCHRVWRAGLRVFYDPGASTTHLGGASSDPQRLSAQARSAPVWRARDLKQPPGHGDPAAAGVRGGGIFGPGAPPGRGRYLNRGLCYGHAAAAFVRAVDILGLGARLAWARLSGRWAEQRAKDWAASFRLITRSLNARSEPTVA